MGSPSELAVIHNRASRTGERGVHPIAMDEERPYFRIELYPFSYFDPMRRRWVRARYRASIEDITASHGAVRIEGPPEVREGRLDPRILAR